MKVRKLLLLHFRTTLRESMFVFVMIGLLFWAFLSNESVSTFLESRSLFQFYSLFTMMLVGYAIIVSVSFAGFLKRKTSKFYHLYMLFPEKPSRFLFVEMLPTFTIALLSAWGVGVLLYHRAPSPLWLIMPILGSALFTWGLGMLSLALTLQVSNVRALNTILFLLIFVLARIPKYVAREGLSLDLATEILMVISVLVALVGSLALERVNPERIILSS